MGDEYSEPGWLDDTNPRRSTSEEWAEFHVIYGIRYIVVRLDRGRVRWNRGRVATGDEHRRLGTFVLPDEEAVREDEGV